MKAVALALLLMAPLVPAVAADDGGDGVNHVDVFVPPFMGCTWTGSYKPALTTEAVTVWVYTCDPET